MLRAARTPGASRISAFPSLSALRGHREPRTTRAWAIAMPMLTRLIRAELHNRAATASNAHAAGGARRFDESRARGTRDNYL